MLGGTGSGGGEGGARRRQREIGCERPYRGPPPVSREPRPTPTCATGPAGHERVTEGSEPTARSGVEAD
eukprot:4236230-Pleurochrysis_carterae.AAC.1